MGNCYIEVRKQSAKGSESLIADMVRHFHTREYLGKAVVVCDKPVVDLGTSRKQWLKLSRFIQKRRSSTLNADKILKYTHAIAHMQHLRFSTKPPSEDPGSDVYFLAPDILPDIPIQCFTFYLLTSLDSAVTGSVLSRLPQESLVVDYMQQSWSKFHLKPKSLLEESVANEWRSVKLFLIQHDIDISALSTGDVQDIEAMDNALDILLGISHRFLDVANEFQHALEIARPLRLNQAKRLQYDALSLLAHRVQALSLETFTQRFLEVYNEDDTFFLYDFTKGQPSMSVENLAEVIDYHVRAGRKNLAYALRLLYMGRSFRPSM